MSGGRFSENPIDFSPELARRARMLPRRGPRMRLRNTPFVPTLSVLSLRHLPFRERSITTLPGTPSGVLPQTRTCRLPERNATNGNRNAFSEEGFGASQAIPSVHLNHRPDWTGPSGDPSRRRYQVTRLTPAYHIR